MAARTFDENDQFGVFRAAREAEMGQLSPTDDRRDSCLRTVSQTLGRTLGTVDDRETGSVVRHHCTFHAHKRRLEKECPVFTH